VINDRWCNPRPFFARPRPRTTTLDLVSCLFLAVSSIAKLSDTHLSGSRGRWLCMTIVNEGFYLGPFLGSLISLAAISALSPAVSSAKNNLSKVASFKMARWLPTVKLRQIVSYTAMRTRINRSPPNFAQVIMSGIPTSCHRVKPFPDRVGSFLGPIHRFFDKPRGYNR